MQNLPHVGWNVHWVILEEMARQKMGYPSQVGVIHPVMFSFFTGLSPEGFNVLKLMHKKIVGFEVADSDKVSKIAINLVNKVDLLMVPSETAKAAFVNSELKRPIEVVRHGVSELFDVPKSPLPTIPRDGINILYFEVHSTWRKGGDVVEKAMSRILNEYKNVRLILRGGVDNRLCRLPRTTCIQMLSDSDLVRLYDSCDILLCPSRGGAFELNVLEGLARGLVCITSSYPSIREYAEPYGTHFIRDKGQVVVLPANPVHVGKGSDPDPDHAYELLKHVINHLPELKKRAEELAPEVRRKYSWRNSARQMADALGRVVS